MGQTCCGTKPDDLELNSHKTQGVRGERNNFDPEKQENFAAVTIQRYFKGLMTRRVIKARYGFEAKHTAFAMPTYTQSDQQILEARKLVM
jgi:hypothetical protein